MTTDAITFAAVGDIAFCGPCDQAEQAGGTGWAFEKMGYLAELDRKVADDATVRANWRRTALELLDVYLGRVKSMDRLEVLENLLGRLLLLVAENRSWVEEVFAVVKANWARRAEQVDPYHRPHWAFSSREKADRPGGG